MRRASGTPEPCSGGQAVRGDVPPAVRPSHAVPTVLQRQGEWSLRLPFTAVQDAPNLNDRDHWAVKAGKVKLWRDAAHVLARQARIPPCQRVRVELHYVPATNQRRDPDNLVAAYKPLCDGLVDAKVVADDTEHYVERVFPIIHPARRTLAGPDSRFVLRIIAL